MIQTVIMCLINTLCDWINGNRCLPEFVLSLSACMYISSYWAEIGRIFHELLSYRGFVISSIGYYGFLFIYFCAITGSWHVQ